MIRVGFYKGKGTIFDRLIRWWCDGKYSHCELVIPNDTWFSADANTNRVRYTTFSPNPNNWDYVEFDTTEREEMIIRAWADSKIGKGYDYLGLAGFVLPFNTQNPNRYFCSEVCIEALQQIGKFPRVVSSSVDPVRLARLCSLK